MTNGDGFRQRHVFGATVLGLGGLGGLGGLAGWELSLVLLPEQPLASSWEGLGPNWAAGQLEQLLTYNHRRQQEMSMFHKVKEHYRITGYGYQIKIFL